MSDGDTRTLVRQIAEQAGPFVPADDPSNDTQTDADTEPHPAGIGWVGRLIELSVVVAVTGLFVVAAAGLLLWWFTRAVDQAFDNLTPGDAPVNTITSTTALLEGPGVRVVVVESDPDRTVLDVTNPTTNTQCFRLVFDNDNPVPVPMSAATRHLVTVEHPDRLAAPVTAEPDSSDGCLGGLAGTFEPAVPAEAPAVAVEPVEQYLSDGERAEVFQAGWLDLPAPAPGWGHLGIEVMFTGPQPVTGPFETCAAIRDRTGLTFVPADQFDGVNVHPAPNDQRAWAIWEVPFDAQGVTVEIGCDDTVNTLNVPVIR